MLSKSLVLAGLVALLSACAQVPTVSSQAPLQRWDGGVWNSVLGYHGPANATVAGGP